LLERDEEEDDENTRDGPSSEVGSGDVLENEDEEVVVYPEEEDELSQEASNGPNI
jgi:hypothetical protein